jgi:hypothetical protein
MTAPATAHCSQGCKSAESFVRHPAPGAKRKPDSAASRAVRKICRKKSTLIRLRIEVIVIPPGCTSGYNLSPPRGFNRMHFGPIDGISAKYCR